MLSIPSKLYDVSRMISAFGKHNHHIYLNRLHHLMHVSEVRNRKLRANVLRFLCIQVASRNQLCPFNLPQAKQFRMSFGNTATADQCKFQHG